MNSKSKRLFFFFTLILAMGIFTSCNFPFGPAKTTASETVSDEEPEYTLSDDGASYLVTGIGTYTGTDLTIPATYNGKPVTAIGDEAFCGCSGLTGITIPDSVTAIGAEAFEDCVCLRSVTIGKGVENIGKSAFYRCYKLIEVYNLSAVPLTPDDFNTVDIDWISNVRIYTSANIPSKIFTDKDGYVLFADNDEQILLAYTGNKTELVLPEGITRIGPHCFADIAVGSDGAPTSRITSVVIPDSVTSIGTGAFFGCTGLQFITIGNGVESIGDEAFYDCSGLTGVTIPDGVMSIGDEAFYYCTGLISVTIGSGVESIGGEAFSGCMSLQSVTIPNSVESIGEDAFFGCTNLSYNDCNGGKYLGNSQNPYIVLIKGTDTSGIHPNTRFIDASAFSGCAMRSVTIPDSVISIGPYAFYGCTGLRSVTIGNGVESIGYGTFYGCTGLQSVTIPDSATSIGGEAFSGCTGLRSVTIGNSVTSIGDEAFAYCTGLLSVTIPGSVTSVGFSAFLGCTGLRSVTIGNGVESIGDWAFFGCTNLSEIIFTGTRAQWDGIGKGSGWDRHTGSYVLHGSDD